jgi:hypothetical protein
MLQAISIASALGSEVVFSKSLNRTAKGAFCDIVDFLQEYADCDELYNQRQKLEAGDDLNNDLQKIKAAGGAIYYGSRDVMIKSRADDKPPLKFNVGYYYLMTDGLASIDLVVTKDGKFI